MNVYVCGPASHAPENARVRRGLARAGQTLVLIVASLGAQATAWAQQGVPLTLAHAEDLALSAEPGQAAFAARADALEERAVAAGELPDPKLRVGLVNFPLEAGGFTTEGMTQAQLGIRQAFPAGKTRALSTRQFRSLASEMDYNADARGRDVLTAVRNAWLDAYYWQRAQTIVSESRPFFADLVTVTKSLYAVGNKDQQDVLRAELELSRLDDRLIDIDRQRAQARGTLARWVSDAASRTIAEKLPNWSSVPPRAALEADLAGHPALEAAQAKVDARHAGIELANERYKPGWALDLGYGYRDGRLPNGDSRSDFISLGVTVDLPVFRKNRQDRSVAAALRERRAALDTKEELRRRLTSQLEVEYARWQDLNRRIDLYESQILAQAKDNADAALSAYQSEAGDFAEVMRAYIDELNTRLELTRLHTERAQSYAVLANLGGLAR